MPAGKSPVEQVTAHFASDISAVADMATHLAEDSDVGMEALFVANKVISVYRWGLSKPSMFVVRAGRHPWLWTISK